ncbi:hypothetical protein CRUP_016952, partial [Coryphaenoides rupestris]
VPNDAAAVVRRCSSVGSPLGTTLHIPQDLSCLPCRPPLTAPTAYTRGKKTKCTAPQYVDFVMSLCQKLVTDEEIFPTKYGEYLALARSSPTPLSRWKKMPHTAHWAHFKETVALDLQGHLNTLYAHFIVFVREFNLVDPKETCIMDDLSEVICAPAPPAPASAAPAASSSPSSQNHVTER